MFSLSFTIYCSVLFSALINHSFKVKAEIISVHLRATQSSGILFLDE